MSKNYFWLFSIITLLLVGFLIWVWYSKTKETQKVKAQANLAEEQLQRLLAKTPEAAETIEATNTNNTTETKINETKTIETNEKV